jgi:type I restriction enzyme M protein
VAPQSRLLLRALPSLDDLLRNTVGRRYYPNLILPCVQLRRLECMLADTREAVNEAHASGADREQLLCLAGYSFYKTWPFDFPRLCAEPANLRVHFQAYLEGWSPNIQELLRAFDFRDRIGQLDAGNVLRLFLQRFADLDLHPRYCSSDEVSNLFEELLRRCFGSTWYPGEYFTPPEVATLLARLLTEGDESFAAPAGAVSVYDPCCGSGRLLITFQDYLRRASPEHRTDLYGQELNQGSAALCKINLYMRGHTEVEVSQIAVGSTLSHDQHADHTFPYMLANPPYGQSWGKGQGGVFGNNKVLD